MSTVNLLPEDYLEHRAQQRANVLCLALLSVVIAGVIAAAVVSEDLARQVRSERDEVNQEYQQAGELIEQMQKLESKKALAVAKAQVAAGLLERVPRSWLLANLTNALPSGASLTKVKLVTKQPAKALVSKAKSKFRARSAQRAAKGKKKDAAAEAKTEPEPLEVTLEVVGLAETDVQVAQFISNMQNNPLMRSVELAYSEEKTIDEETVREFQVLMELKPHAEVEIAQASDPAAAGTVTLGGGTLEGTIR